MSPETLKKAGIVDPASPSAEPFRMLRLAIELRPNASATNAVLVTSPHAGDGKSTIAANYAVVASLTRRRVLLIDGDLRSPSVHGLFGLDQSPGLVELVRDQLDLSEVVQRIEHVGLDVLTSGGAISRPGDLAASSQFEDVLAQARASYDLVVIDSPPVLIAADAAGIAAQDGVGAILVVPRNARRRHVGNAIRKLRLMDANVLGLVVNREGSLTTYGY
jgi:capsular exopolysaccharide synthesis family protein